MNIIVSGNMLQRIKIPILFTCLGLMMNACEHQPPEIKKGSGGNSDTTIIVTKCSPDSIYFVNEILPLLNSNCAQSGCHDAITKEDGVQLDNYQSIMSTGEVKPGKPNSSKIYEVLNETDPDKRMPPAGSLSQEQKDKIFKWISQGAPNNYCQSGCDSTVFTYSGAVSKIVNTNCVACHSSGNVLLNSHAALQTVALNGRLWGALNHLNGFQPMPSPNTFLSECDLKKIKKWIDAGAPNN